MINFVSRDEKKEQAVLRTRQMVVMWTSVIFGIYIVVIAGFLGWRVYWGSKEKKVNTEEVQLRKEITQLSENEILAIKLSDRAKEINKFVSVRGNVVERAEKIPMEGYVISGWEYNLEGENLITIIGRDPKHLWEYENYLREKYDIVQVSRVLYDPQIGWKEEISVSGFIKS